jgi:hypothetical protein
LVEINFSNNTDGHLLKLTVNGAIFRSFKWGQFRICNKVSKSLDSIFVSRYGKNSKFGVIISLRKFLTTYQSSSALKTVFAAIKYLKFV